MEFKFRHTEKIVGGFVFIALAVLIAGIVLIAFSQKLWVKTYTFRTRLAEATGLSTASTLSFKGYEIGRVKRFRLNEENTIDVEFEVYEEFREKMVPGSVIYRQVNPVTGKTSLILLYPRSLSIELAWRGEDTIAQEEGSLIYSLDMREGQLQLENDMVEKSGDTLSIIFEDTRDFISHLREEFQLKKDSFKTAFGQLGDFAQSLANNKTIFDRLNLLLDPARGPVFTTLARFNQISQGLQQATNQLNELLANYKNPDGLANKILQVDQTKINGMLENINKNLTALHRVIQTLQEQAPLLAEVLSRTEQTLQAINNNPLLRGGIQKKDTKTNASKKKRVDIDQ